jgi:hypothetical protein
MNERPSLFRREALEFHAGRPAHGGVLRIDLPWTRWLYWIVLALVVAAVALVTTVRTSQTTSGPTLTNVRERTFVALVPAAASPDLHRGQLVRLQLPGATRPALAGRVIRSEVADRAGLRRAGFPPSSQPATLVTGVLEGHVDRASLPPSPRHAGRAVVVLRSQRLIDLFLQPLRGILGTGGDS